MANHDAGIEEQGTLFESRCSTREARESAPAYSKFIVYVDESGDHGLANIDEGFPVFCLALCVFHKRHYTERVVPDLQRFKFEHFGHDVVVLHESEIRKERGQFRFRDANHKAEFLGELSRIIESINFVLIACVVKKKEIRPPVELDIYEIALEYTLLRLYDFLREKGELDSKTHVVFEKRGKKEDDRLELAFRRIVQGSNREELILPFEIVFASKQVNSAGLQLADLVARPIALSVFRPNQENRAFQTLKPKFFCEGGRKETGKNFDDYGLTILPSKKAKSPGYPTEAQSPTGYSQSDS